MAEDKELIAKRASYKGRLTMFEKYMDDLDVASLTSAEVNELQLRMAKIESLYGHYDEVQLKLECSSNNSEAQLNERAEFESRYFKLLSHAQDILAKHTKNQESDFNSAASEQSSRKGNNKLVRLPTIQLPKYNGSYENWLGFRDTFTSLIHSNDNIDDINKFHYLRTSLEASAAVVIQSVEFSSDNYALAWQLLCDRFNNKRQLLQNHVSALFNIEPITRESSSHIKRVIDQVNKNLRSLETLGEPVKEWSTLLIHIISQKLDSKSFREWEEFKGGLDKNKTVTFEEFRTFLQNRADLLETLELSSNQSLHNTKGVTKIKTMIAVQEKVGNNINKTQPPAIKPCPSCKGDHCLSNCAQFLALSNTARLQLLPTYKVCFNCFRGGHYANHCKKPGCKICKRKHHTLIHVSEGIHNRSTLNSDNCTGVISGVDKQTAPALPVPSSAEPAQVALSANVSPSTSSSY
ncbi:uncharacterized protein LOC125242701 [Leguminivora glycinivorella]|uniref:uncharacterized protein LOC125242701 n=1 Tax=Leguminivora glycinivorella TaxID=1035111 RepID=UPI00200EE26F|nr:uncharacterized protein LOC125242701 [Leguminivora glycinivorella]